ncbi:MAG: bacillithiol system oxidoreductase YphP [Bacteroidetes bacterium HLUCCA01]|nr:MAG: bacillithiol system oxidoreductase YphP [Bacteroidetes bacterium HLUCCA01]
MQFGFGIGPDTSWMRTELTDLGVKELRTPEDVDAVLGEKKEGTMLLVINSVCGCAAGNARPGVKIALENEKQPDHMYTVFAGQDREATERARGYFSEFPPSSPSFAFFKDGEIKAMIPRHRVEGRSAQEVANDLMMIFNAFC